MTENTQSQNTEAAATPAAEETKNDASQLQLNDLITMLQVVQLAASRAAFRVEEYTSIGACYERIFNFLAANGAIKTPGAGAPATAQNMTPSATGGTTASPTLGV